jgi:predicted exporter
MNHNNLTSTTQPLSRSNLLYALGWLLVFCASAIFCLWQVTANKPFHSNLLELLPHDERNPALHELSLLMASRFEDKLLILVKSDNPEIALPQAQDLQARLLASERFAAGNVSQTIQQELIALYRPFSQQLLSLERREWLQNTSREQIAEQTYRDLFSPVALPRPYGFAEDPFNLGGAWLASLAPRLKMQEYHGFPLVVDEQMGEQDGASQSWLLVTARLNSSPFDVATQQDVIQAIKAFRQQWPDAEILTSGMIFHAAAGTEQATREINTVGLGSTIAIVLMVVAVFRRVTPLFAVFLSMTAAYVLALTVSLLVFGSIHIITLAFGSTLLGVAGDYAIHFLVTSQATGSGLAARRHLKHAMAIGALTGMGAYLLQFTTPFPGLQQMAIFCAAGIFGAWMTVLALAPFYRVNPASANSPMLAAERFFALAQWVYPKLWAKPRLVGGILVLITAAGIFAIARGGVNDAVVNLNTSPMALLASERKVQTILQQPSVSRFFYIEADSPEQLLQRTQALTERLTALKEPDLRWQSLQQYVPSQAQQQADRALIAAKLYGENGALKLLCQKLETSCAEPVATNKLLNPADLNASQLGDLLPPMLKVGEGWRTLVTLSGSGQSAHLGHVAEGLEGVRLVNQTEDLSQLLGRYRSSVSVVLLVTLLLLAGGLTLRYRQQGWRMITPLTIAMTIALACASLDGITLFHIMALLLIIGIGLDTAVFYTEGGFNAESWLASSLSCGTSIIAFGLLSLSAVPVLHQFGLIILVGILSCWMLTPLFFRVRLNAQPGQEPHNY